MDEKRLPIEAAPFSFRPFSDMEESVKFFLWMFRRLINLISVGWLPHDIDPSGKSISFIVDQELHLSQEKDLEFPNRSYPSKKLKGSS